MKLWLDAQLSPLVAAWIENSFEVVESVFAVQSDVALRSAGDAEIFRRAGQDQAVVITKDRDFVDMLERRGPPPKVIWLTCGNTSNRALQGILVTALPEALEILEAGAAFVEITGP